MLRTCLLIGLVALLSFAPVASAAEPVQLFNGKDLAGWKLVVNDANAKMEDIWTVADGILKCKGKPTGYIRTEADYESFVLKVEWRFTNPGNSGVLLRQQLPDKVWPKSIECQLNHGAAGDIWNIDKFPMTVAAERTEGRRTKKLHDSSEKPLGEWNEYEITCDGPKLELKVNGVVQNTATDCEIVAGKICLQSEGGELEFRKVELTPLPSRAKASAKREGPIKLLNGKDLEGWTGYFKDGSKAADSFKVEKGVLKYAGGKDGFLLTEKDYDNYLLRLQYRFTEKKGDSGVLIRTTPADKIWPKSLEAQGKADDAGDIWLLDGFKADAKGKNVKKLQPSSEKPVGEWNDYEIVANGSDVELRVNSILQNKLGGVDTTPGRIALQAQDVPVEFKDIVLWPLPDPAKPEHYQRLEGLDGWHITGVGHWTYKDGIIDGKQGKDVTTYTHVVSDKSYKDFKTSLKFKAIAGNSGFYFRILVDATGNVHGFQAEIDEDRDAGGLYESWGRGWVSKPEKADVEKYFKKGDWNEMVVEAKGPKVLVTVNGAKAAEINDPNVRQEGPFALQIHGGQDVHVQFKDIKIEPLD